MDNNLIFGIRPVVEAIEAGREIEKLYIRKGAEGQLMTELRDLCLRHRVRVQEVPVEKLNRLVRGNHQGVVAQIAAIAYVQLDDILERVPDDETPLVVVFDGVTDVRNFGAIARSAECAGARAHRAAQKFRAGQRRSDPSIGRRAHDDPRLPRRLDPQHDQNVAGRRIPGGRRHRKEPQTALRRRPASSDRARNGRRGDRYLEGGAQTLRRTTGHSAHRPHRIAQRLGRSGRNAVRSRPPTHRRSDRVIPRPETPLNPQ